MAYSIPLIEMVCPCCNSIQQLQLHQNLNESMTRCLDCKQNLMVWPELKTYQNAVAIVVQVVALPKEMQQRIDREREKAFKTINSLLKQAS